MDIYIHMMNMFPVLCLMSDLMYTTWAAELDLFDDLDGADYLINSLASALLQPDGIEDTGQRNERGECVFTCPRGVKPRKNHDYVPTSNGCGAYGLKLDLSDIPNIEKCCETHDICYGTCNKKMSQCDDEFTWCLNSVCEELEDDMGLNQEETEGCMMVAQLMSTTVQTLGCGAYLDSQALACKCSENRKSASKKKRNTEL